MKFTPHNYQQYGIDRIINEDMLGLFLDMGLGKTSITLTAVEVLKYKMFKLSKVLVIAPKKVAEGTWSKEAFKWDHTKKLRINKVLGTAKQRIRALNTPGDIYIINRDNVVWLVDYYRNNWPFEMVIVDESSSFKNHKAKRFKALTWVRDQIKKIVLLTGTPRPNSAMDLWSQLYLLDKGQRLEKNITQFRVRYFEKNYDGFSYKQRPGADEAIQEKIKDICVSMKADDYLELPDLITNTIPVVLDTEAEKAYKELEKQMLLEIDPDTVVEVTHAAALSNKLLQLCNGAIYGEDREVHEIHNCKLEALQETVERLNGKPALVFYNYQHDIPRIKKALEPMGLRIRELKTTQDEDDWNAGKIDILLTHPASSAYGLNLQDGGNHVIWFGLNWNLELFLQANKRLHRQGQTQKVIVHLLVVVGGRDEDVIESLWDKERGQEKLLQSLKARIEKYKAA